MDTAERLEYLSSFVLAFSDLVEVRSSSEKGFGLHSSKACAEGCVLLRVPFSSCITREDADIQELDPQALLRLSTLRTMQQPEDPRAVYLCMAAPLASFTSHPAAWPASLASSCCSLAARRSRGWREALEMEWRQWKERQVIPPDTSEKDHFWSALLVQTRALDTELKGLLLCPGVDLCNHVSVAPTAKVQVKDGHMTLVASYAMEPGDEVSISYYPEADYLDLFEAYGFFDSSCQIHTVEVPLSLATLQDQASTARRALAIRGYAKGGYAEDLEAWWVPDFNVEACPLWLAVRACFADEEELGERLGDPIRREKEVKAFLRQIFQTHLDTYGSVEGTEAAPAAAISAARELVKFETTLLRSLLEVCAEKGCTLR